MTDHGEPELWRSVEPRHGVVREVVEGDGYVARFDDLNSDGREVCVTIFRRTATGLEWFLEVDDAGMIDEGGSCASSDLAFSWGVDAERRPWLQVGAWEPPTRLPSAPGAPAYSSTLHVGWDSPSGGPVDDGS